MREIVVAGGGPAGAAAAIAALRDGAAVHIRERARAPRHKVCGEFLSPEACHVLDTLGVWSEIARLGPPIIRRCALHFGRRTKIWTLSEPARGLSRLALDRLLLDRAVNCGADLARGAVYRPGPAPAILACGRPGGGSRAARLFGFKSHFRGPAHDTVELYFTRFGYLGISPVEGRLTNVCGIAREDALLRCGFDIDAFLAGEAALAERLRPLNRAMPWLKTGPLLFSRVTRPGPHMPGVYPAGDALGFVDPFTGSGILNALLTGSMAGSAAARGTPVPTYLKQCAELLDAPFAVSSAFRFLLRSGLSSLAFAVPGDWLYRLTRAHRLQL